MTLDTLKTCPSDTKRVRKLTDDSESASVNERNVRRDSMVSRVALMTGGGDKPYALGLGAALVEQNVPFDFIGSDDVHARDLPASPHTRFFNLRGDQNPSAPIGAKIWRVVAYYGRILRYAVTTRAKVFHLLWHNKFDLLDRTLVMGFYKLLGKRLVFTAHNVNAGKRDGNDNVWNRLSLASQYRLADHVFVHTEMMKRELMAEFRVPEKKVTVIPFGINNTLPRTSLTRQQARERLGIAPDDKVVLFFGNIAPYKGVEFLAQAMTSLIKRDRSYRLVIAGRPKGVEAYWAQIRGDLEQAGVLDRVTEGVEYIPDANVEMYFKASDLLVLPYRHIFQSGVLFLGYSFGLPVLATDVGSLKEEIISGQTGLVCRPEDVSDLQRQIAAYFASDLYKELENRRADIMRFANERYSWTKVGEITRRVYEQLLASE